MIRPLASPTEAAAFIIGLAGLRLLGIAAPEQHPIRNYFPGWFGSGYADKSDPADPTERDPSSPVKDTKTLSDADAPLGRPARMISRAGRPFQSPSLDPDTDTCLFRSLRFNLDDGLRNERGVDLYAAKDADKTIFYLRHWNWCDTGSGICQITSKEEAARFIRVQQFTKPGRFIRVEPSRAVPVFAGSVREGVRCGHIPGRNFLEMGYPRLSHVLLSRQGPGHSRKLPNRNRTIIPAGNKTLSS
ncbi:hypothetical protein [uncultured Methanoregula sp.]|uniref:hypothetical protein n=1 Tax=uncultured Methanoregula sp. TaxID=1005933 RepID=UPI002AAAC68C|nr:hypothetical protein [uncultured Methanoregula sp.]